MKHFVCFWVVCFFFGFIVLGCNGSVRSEAPGKSQPLDQSEIQDQTRPLAERINAAYARDSAQRTILVSKVGYVSGGFPGCSYVVRVGQTLISGVAWVNGSGSQDTWICNVQSGKDIIHDTLEVTK